MLILLLLGVALWIAISVPTGLLVARIFKLEEGEVSAAPEPADLELDRLDLSLPVAADPDWAGGADRLAQAG
jgi:hypothetical protein